jgi:hypothetical protein
MSGAEVIATGPYSASGQDRYSPAVPETPPPTPASEPRRSGRATIAYWLVAGVIYAALGAAYPPAFLLGFWESLIFVFAATALAPKVLGRFT